MQRDLFDETPERPGRPSIQERFEAFHRAHPDVYLLFKRFAFEVCRSGRRRYGAKSIFERIRWHYATSNEGEGKDEDFKLNNVFSSRYARLLVEEHPEMEGVFEMRRLRS